MRSAIILCSGFLSLHVAAQKTIEHTTMLDDSVRQVERINRRSEKVLSRHFYVGDRPVGTWQEFDDKGQLLAVRDFSELRYDSAPALPKDTADAAVVETIRRRLGTAPPALTPAATRDTIAAP